ncbi:hypothetical protein PRK78_004627 [Emydomyces testavorans]|uniref:Uncharacterized protein n=1 Tax=Emydomyces testavorans TaxID=2070801 RepID=A0AAF0IJE2_9EURO|nr:hypothetical protein PRK78_004627 [Emydomyces testavorans]
MPAEKGKQQAQVLKQKPSEAELVPEASDALQKKVHKTSSSSSDVYEKFYLENDSKSYDFDDFVEALNQDPRKMYNLKKYKKKYAEH